VPEEIREGVVVKNECMAIADSCSLQRFKALSQEIGAQTISTIGIRNRQMVDAAASSVMTTEYGPHDPPRSDRDEAQSGISE
jgi:hypothetical protein